MAISVWLKGLGTAFHFAGRLFGLLRKIPVVDDTVDHLQRTLFNPVVVKLIRNASDPDLDDALKLYAKRIPDDQRFDGADIIRWIREDQISRRNSQNAPTDWFVLAKMKRKVCGFILFHYYPSAQHALFAYMVVANTPGIPFDAVSRSLTAEVSRLLKKRRELRGCEGFVIEVEDPRRENIKSKRTECLARIRRFCTLAEMQGFSLRAFDINYKQPRLSLEDSNSIERPLLLLSARNRQNTCNEENHYEEAKEMLSFVYKKVYPEGYSPDFAENKAYRDYCESFLETEIASLPSCVRSLSAAQLAAMVGNSKHRAGTNRAM